MKNLKRPPLPRSHDSSRSQLDSIATPDGGRQGMKRQRRVCDVSHPERHPADATGGGVRKITPAACL